MRKSLDYAAKALTKSSIRDKLKARSKQNSDDQISTKNKHGGRSPGTSQQQADETLDTLNGPRPGRPASRKTKEPTMAKNTTTPTTTTPSQPKDWSRTRETAKTIIITILATAIIAFAAGIWYEKNNTANVLSATTTTAEAPASK